MQVGLIQSGKGSKSKHGGFPPKERVLLPHCHTEILPGFSVFGFKTETFTLT